MSWQKLAGHEQQRVMFERAVSRGRLGHAYLLAGPVGVGKRTFAQLLAQSLLCERRPKGELTCCDECPGCRQVLSRTHPDFMQVGLPEGKSELPIEVFVGAGEKRGREGLCHELSLSPMHGGHRVAIIDDADKMNIASANALLKTLEEPGPGAVLILIAEDADQVIQTIRSRCQQVYFGPLTDGQVQQVLKEQGLLEDLEASPAMVQQGVEQAKGSVQRALEWLQRSGQQATGGADFRKVLTRGSFRAKDLFDAGEVVMSQYGSETHGQREGALWILDCCLQHCYARLLELSTNLDADDFERDAWGDALERCLDATIQIDRRASVPLCLEAFYQDFEFRLRPTWKNVVARS